MSELAVEALRKYHWPGNVKQLQEMMHAVAARFVTEPRITIELLRKIDPGLGRTPEPVGPSKKGKKALLAFRRLRQAREIHDGLLTLPASRPNQNYGKVLEQSQPDFASKINTRYGSAGAPKIWDFLANKHADIHAGIINPWRLAQHIWKKGSLDTAEVELGRLHNEVADIRASRPALLGELTKELQDLEVAGFEQPLLREMYVQDQESLRAELSRSQAAAVARTLLENTCQHLFFSLTPSRRSRPQVRSAAHSSARRKNVSTPSSRIEP